MSNLVFSILFPLIMSLIMILPVVFFNNLHINKKLFFICTFINYFFIICFHLNMKDIFCFILLISTAFVYLFFTYKKIVYSITIIILINVVISLGDHLTELLFTIIIKISTSQIQASKLLLFSYAFLTLLISCVIGEALRVIFLNIKKIFLNSTKTKDK